MWLGVVCVCVCAQVCASVHPGIFCKHSTDTMEQAGPSADSKPKQRQRNIRTKKATEEDDGQPEEAGAAPELNR